jgi:hypothetical protein
MNSFNPIGVEKTTPLFSLGMVAVLAIPTLLLVAVVGVTGYFRLSSDVVALRQSFMNEVDGSWQKKFAIHLGPLTTAFVRMCSHWAKVEPEPAAALETIRMAEVGVYNISCEPRAVDAGAILARADKAMSSRVGRGRSVSAKSSSWWRYTCQGEAFPWVS